MTLAEPKATKFGQFAVLSAAFLGWMFDGLEMGLFPLVAAPALRELLETTDPKVIGPWFSWLTMVFLLGAAAGGLVFGWLGDRIGRVAAMSLSIVAYAVFTGLGYFVQSAEQLLGLRFLAALGMGGEWALGVALVMEMWPSDWRPFLAGFIGAASNVGFLLIAVVGLYAGDLDANWRWMMLAGGGPALLCIFIQLFVPESHAWKASKRQETAPVNPVAEIFGPRLRRSTLLGIAFGAVALVGTWGSVQWIPTWVGSNEFQVASTEGMSEKETAVERSKVKSFSQIASAAGAIVGCFMGSLLGGAIGRRPVYFFLCLASLASALATFNLFDSYSTNFLAMVFLVGMTTAAFYGWLPLYLPELFPTRVRATGQGVAFNAGRVVAAAGVLLTGQLVAGLGSYAKAGAVISCVYLVGMAIIWLAPETKGRPLPE
jgi:SHS family sialic acid transporter-like MFS transporter